MNITTLRQWTYELPQTLLGYILTKIYSKKLNSIKAHAGAQVYIYDGFPGGISLGRYILIQDVSWWPEYQDEMIKHEFGHCVQSKYLGWLYLPTIGICSGLHSLTYRWRKKQGWINSYYDYWTEKLADKLGGVKRGDNYHN